MAPRKVCIATHTFLPHVGGIERVVYEQSSRLPKYDFEPKVLTSRMGRNRDYVLNGIKVQCYDSLNIGFRFGIPYTIPHFLSYKTFLHCINLSDIVHAHGHPYLSSLLASGIAKKQAKPLVVTQHNTFIKYNGFLDTVERLNDLTVGKGVLRRADKILVVSNATQKYVLSLGISPKKIEVIHNGVDLSRFKNIVGAREKIRRKLKISKESIVVLTVRRLVFKNGIDTLIESAKTAIGKNKKLVFLVIGNGPDFKEVKSRVEQLKIADEFRLTGFVSDQDLPFHYNAADFFVLPSKSGEGLPLVILEAMASGLPVIATKVGGIPEVMIEGLGSIVPPDNPKALADAIVDLSLKKLAPLKEELRGRVTEKHSWDKNVAKLVEIYEELI